MIGKKFIHFYKIGEKTKDPSYSLNLQNLYKVGMDSCFKVKMIKFIENYITKNKSMINFGKEQNQT
jgi:hypothetical protein